VWFVITSNVEARKTCRSVVIVPTLKKKGALETVLDALKRHGGSGIVASSTLVGLALKGFAAALLGGAH
jgi:hypothetical protein